MNPPKKKKNVFKIHTPEFDLGLTGVQSSLNPSSMKMMEPKDLFLPVRLSEEWRHLSRLLWWWASRLPPVSTRPLRSAQGSAHRKRLRSVALRLRNLQFYLLVMKTLQHRGVQLAGYFCPTTEEVAGESQDPAPPLEKAFLPPSFQRLQTRAEKAHAGKRGDSCKALLSLQHCITSDIIELCLFVVSFKAECVKMLECVSHRRFLKVFFKRAKPSKKLHHWVIIIIVVQKGRTPTVLPIVTTKG